MRMLVIGATGVLGRHVVPRLIERGHVPRAIVRSEEQALFLQQAGAETRRGDIFDVESLEEAAEGCEAALHLATAIPRQGFDYSLNDRIRREGTGNVLRAAARQGVRRYVQQSIALLYGECGTNVVDESAPAQATGITQSAADMEAQVRAAGLDWCILRGGLFYGAGTGREDAWRQAAREGRLTLPGDGEHLISLVHVVDMARAVVAAAESAKAGTMYNVVDDEPTSYRRLFDYISAQMGTRAAQAGGARGLPSLGCSNARIKREVGWAPAFPSYRSGLA